MGKISFGFLAETEQEVGADPLVDKQTEERGDA